jgi:hypothetical protein
MGIAVITPQGKRRAGRPFWRGTSPAGLKYTVSRLGAWHNDDPGEGVWLHAGTEGSAYSVGAFLVRPIDMDDEKLVLVRQTRLGSAYMEGDEYNFEFVAGRARHQMDALSPEGLPLGSALGETLRDCWSALVPALDAYFRSS